MRDVNGQRFRYLQNLKRHINDLVEDNNRPSKFSEVIFKHYRISCRAVLHMIIEIRRTERDSKIHDVSRQFKNGGTISTDVFMDRHG